MADPHGGEWVVRRKWAHRRLRWRGKKGAGDLFETADLIATGGDLPVIGVILMAVALLLLAIAAVMFVVPALIFIGELLFIVAIVGLGTFGRLLLGRPWTVEALEVGGDEAYEWKVSGWRASRDLVQTVSDQLRATGPPTGASRIPNEAS